MKHSGKIWLFGVSAAMLAFILFNTPGLTQAPEQAENSADNKDYEEVFSDGDSNGVVYINWLSPKATNEFSCAWFLGAYRFNDGSLCVDLDRRNNILTNNLRYAINCSACDNSALFLYLLTTNGVVLAESGDLLTASNVVRYVIPAPVLSKAEGEAGLPEPGQGIQSTNLTFATG